jgi:hypothetical protein
MFARNHAMAAHFYCWDPSLPLKPLAPDFKRQVNTLRKLYHSATPSPRVLAFVEELLSRFPNPREAGENSIWAVSHRLQDEIVGDFIHFAVLWYYYEEVQPSLHSRRQISGCSALIHSSAKFTDRGCADLSRRWMMVRRGEQAPHRRRPKIIPRTQGVTY